MLHVELSRFRRFLRFPKRVMELLRGRMLSTNRCFEMYEIPIMGAYILDLIHLDSNAARALSTSMKRKIYKNWINYVRSRYESGPDPFVHTEELSSRNQRIYLQLEREVKDSLAMVLRNHPSLAA